MDLTDGFGRSEEEDSKILVGKSRSRDSKMNWSTTTTTTTKQMGVEG